MLGIPLGRVGARSTVCEDERGRFSSNLPVLGFSRSPNRAGFTPPTHMCAVLELGGHSGAKHLGTWNQHVVCPVICLRHAYYSDIGHQVFALTIQPPLTNQLALAAALLVID